MKAVIFRHNLNPVGAFDATLKKAGVEFEIMETWRDDVPADFDALKPDLLIVMGGAPGAYQAEQYPFLAQEIDVLEKRLAADLPTLGVCLGAQLMAKALGAKNYRGTKGYEIGWCKIDVNDSGMKTPMKHLDASQTWMTQSHKDTFDLPEGAILLASSDKYENQAFSYGDNALGVQFHPEADAAACRAWYVSYSGALEDEEIDLNVWRKQTVDYLPTLMSQSEKFLTEWLAKTRRESELQYA
jgi:GMP synthase (glutamine-hydrolysing)